MFSSDSSNWRESFILKKKSNMMEIEPYRPPLLLQAHNRKPAAYAKPSPAPSSKNDNTIIDKIIRRKGFSWTQEKEFKKFSLSRN